MQARPGQMTPSVTSTSELEAILAQLVAEHRRLLAHVEQQQEAMRAMDVRAMELAAAAQEGSRQRIASLETRRRAQVIGLARAARLPATATLPQIAAAHTDRHDALMALRHDLRQAIDAVQRRTFVAGKLAGSLLGHLSTVVRLIAGAVEQAGVYTKQGMPQVSRRIGVIEAVG